MEVSAIFDVNTKEFSEAMEIYIESFPENTRHPLELIKVRIKNGQNQLFIGKNQKEVIVFAIIYCLHNPNVILLDYYAVKRVYRNNGIGTAFLKELFNTIKLKEKNRYLIFEVDDPNYGLNKSEREKRVQFYSSLNVVQIKQMQYIFPPLSGTKYIEMILMIYPRPKRKDITSLTLREIIIELYVEKYSRQLDDPLLKTTLSSIPKKIRYI